MQELSPDFLKKHARLIAFDKRGSILVTEAMFVNQMLGSGAKMGVGIWAEVASWGSEGAT